MSRELCIRVFAVVAKLLDAFLFNFLIVYTSAIARRKLVNSSGALTAPPTIAPVIKHDCCLVLAVFVLFALIPAHNKLIGNKVECTIVNHKNIFIC